MRKVKIRLEDYGSLEVGRPYPVLVCHIAKKRRQSALEATVRHLDSSQEGREQKIDLPLPALPNGQTARFFRAAGAHLSGEEDRPIDVIVGRKLRIVFADGESGMEPIGFEPHQMENLA
jgi:hypothetical protein